MCGGQHSEYREESYSGLYIKALTDWISLSINPRQLAFVAFASIAAFVVVFVTSNFTN
jgi:hypothetical protein